MPTLANLEFIWLPNQEWDLQKKPNINVTKFGDGYEQRVANGINTESKSFKLSFTRSISEIKAIDRFLSVCQAQSSFLWTPPLGKKTNYVCREWSINKTEQGLLTLSTSFELVYEASSTPTIDYDMQGYLDNGGVVLTPGLHYPDTHKLPNHRTFSKESIFSNAYAYGGTWVSISDGASTLQFNPSPYNRSLYNDAAYIAWFPTAETSNKRLLLSNGGFTNGTL